MKPKPFTRYRTAGGSEAEIYRTIGPHWTNSTNFGQAIGAVLVPNHPALLPGWQESTWNAEDGTHKHPLLTLVEETGPIFLREAGFDYVAPTPKKPGR